MSPPWFGVPTNSSSSVGGAAAVPGFLQKPLPSFRKREIAPYHDPLSNAALQSASSMTKPPVQQVWDPIKGESPAPGKWMNRVDETGSGQSPATLGSALPPT